MVAAVAYSPDGNLLAAAIGSEVVVWERKSCKAKHHLIAHEKGSTRLAFSSDSNSIAGVLGDGSLKVWMLKDVSSTRQLKAHKFPISGLGFSTRNKSLISGSWDGSVMSWDLGTLEKNTLIGVSDEFVSSVAISADLNLLAASTLNGRLRLCDIKQNKETATISLDEPISSIALSHRGNRLLVGFGNPFESPNHKANQGKLVIVELRAR